MEPRLKACNKRMTTVKVTQGYQKRRDHISEPLLVSDIISLIKSGP